MSVTVAKADDYKDSFTVYFSATKSKNLGKVIERLDNTSPSYKAELKGVAESMINMDINFRFMIR